MAPKIRQLRVVATHNVEDVLAYIIAVYNDNSKIGRSQKCHAKTALNIDEANDSHEVVLVGGSKGKYVTHSFIADGTEIKFQCFDGMKKESEYDGKQYTSYRKGDPTTTPHTAVVLKKIKISQFKKLAAKD